MEKRISKKVETYITTFKDSIRDKSTELGIISNEHVNQLLQFVYDYEHVELKKDDFLKRKRVKSMVPHFDRCFAKRANGEQCTRRKKDECEYCGTHMKGTPHGILEQKEGEVMETVQKIEVWAQDIQGIIYYIDKSGNVYQTEDIISNKQNPKIIAKYVKNGEIYSIPSFGI
jgi:hypothetical protein